MMTPGHGGAARHSRMTMTTRSLSGVRGTGTTLMTYGELVARLQQQVEQMQAHPHCAHKPAKIA